MSTELTLRSGLPWLEHQRRENSTPPLQPLVLLPGDGGEGVELEAALLIACSPLLRRTLSSTYCCSCSCATTAVMLPFTTSAALSHLGQMLWQGSVTIASEALTALGALLALLEVDIGRTTGVEQRAAHEKESIQEKPPPPATPTLPTSPSKEVFHCRDTFDPSEKSLAASSPEVEAGLPTTASTVFSPSPSPEFKRSITVKTEPFYSLSPTPSTLHSPPSRETFLCRAASGPSEESLPRSPYPSLPQMSCDLSETSQNMSSAPVKPEPIDCILPTTSSSVAPTTSREAFHCQEPTGPSEGGLSTLPLVISIPFQRLAPKTVQKINSFSQEKVITSPGLPSKSSTSCFFCGLTLPLGADQEHEQVCSARANVKVHMTNPVELIEGKEEEELSIDDQALSLEGCAVQRKRKVYICEKIGCGKMYPEKSRLADHQRSVHGAPKLKCLEPNCSALFIAKDSLPRHMWVEHGIGAGATCEECGERVSNLKKHLRTVHGAPQLAPKHRCSEPGCEAVFTGKEHRRRHIWKKHGIGAGASCEECGKRELNLGLLRKHLRTVHGASHLTPSLVPKHQCSETGCQAVFTQKRYRRRHMWTEHGIGAGAKCDECGKREPDIWHLRNHLRVVHAAPKLRCEKPGCEATFISGWSYRKHLQKHQP